MLAEYEESEALTNIRRSPSLRIQAIDALTLLLR